MQRLDSFEKIPASLQSGALTIGKFDAVHLGHAAILGRTVAHARRLGRAAVAVTFDPPPQEILRPQTAAPPICTLARKLELIAAEGIDAVVVIPTTRQLLGMDAVDFFEQVVVARFKTRALVEGETFTFGRSRGGGPDLLHRLCPVAGITLEIVPPVQIDGRGISSSALRYLIADGRVDEAARRMTQPYRLTGIVEHGEHRGRTLGFPTANLGRIETLLPRAGIYAAVAHVNAGSFRAALHVGPNPTFDVPWRKIEAYLIDFDGDLYGETIDIDLLAPLRDIEKYDSVEALVAQMHADVARCRTLPLPPGVSVKS